MGSKWCFQSKNKCYWLFSKILNLEGKQNCCIGLKVMAILLNWWILTVGGVASRRACACSLHSRLKKNKLLTRLGLLDKGYMEWAKLSGDVFFFIYNPGLVSLTIRPSKKTLVVLIMPVQQPCVALIGPEMHLQRLLKQGRFALESKN